MDILTDLTFWNVAIMVAGLGFLVLAPFVVGVLKSRYENKAFRERLYSGYYENIRSERMYAAGLTQADG